MTRDEAIAKVRSVIPDGCFHDHAVTQEALDIRFVSRLVALGLLKLEEPKSVGLTPLADRIDNARLAAGLSVAELKMFLGALKNRGLRIVDARSQGEG